MSKFHDHIKNEGWDKHVGEQPIGYDPTGLFGVVPVAYNVGASGAVMNGETKEIMYNPYMMKQHNSPYIMAHEMEHILQNRAQKRYGKGFDYSAAFNDAVFKMRGQDPNKVSNANIQQPLRHGLAKPHVMEHMKKIGFNDIYLTNWKRNGKGYDAVNQYSLDELFASLSGWEKATGKDITRDPVMRKEVFQDDVSLIEAYKAVTGLRQDRLDAKDLAPYEPDVTKKDNRSKVQKFVDVFADPFKSTIK